MNRLLLILFLSATLLGLMALLPEERKETAYGSSGRTPSSIYDHDDLKIKDPASGEPSDDGLTQSLHRQFREALEMNPKAAVNVGRELIFTDELDQNFRLKILRELRTIQFVEPGVVTLAGEIILKSPGPILFEEALLIEYTFMEGAEFTKLLSALAQKNNGPEYQAIISNFEHRMKI